MVSGTWLFPTVRTARLVSGLALAFFLATHFSNHALGLVSLGAMEAGRVWFERLWDNPLGLAVLYGSVAVHFVLALKALHARRTWRVPPREIAQYALGFALPLLIIPHVVSTRIAESLLGRSVDYVNVLNGLWIVSPGIGARQVAALGIAWLHGCFGIWFWQRANGWFARWSGVLLAAAIIVPVLSVLGFVSGGRDLAARPDLLAELTPDPGGDSRLAPFVPALYAIVLLPIAAIGIARLVRVWFGRARRIRVSYPGGQVVRVPAGFTVLEASRSARLPHLSVCGGRGRCSTCRVRVLSGMGGLPPPHATERATLARIGASPDVRLACQVRPSADLSVQPLLSAVGQPVLSRRHAESGSRERDIAVLFCDLRGFTRLSEHRLPFDTVFLLNRYFELVGGVVEAEGGYLDKFVGDGALALFGLDGPIDLAAGQALRAALGIATGLETLSGAMREELEGPLRIAMSLHAGPAVVGEMGYGASASLTAIGDTINVASRLESVAKQFDAELVVSADLARAAGVTFAGCRRETVAIRGRAEAMETFVLPRAEALRRAMDPVAA